MGQAVASPSLPLRILRWFARIVGMLLAAFVFLLAVGEGLNPAKLTLEESLMMLGFLATWVGFILGWKWEGIGGVLVIAGLAWHCLFEYVFRGTLFLGFWVALPALPGVLFLIYWWRTRPSVPSNGNRESGGPPARPS